ncbi:MAG: S24 family peptidase, partial [Spirochaetota bacterium]
DLDAIDPLPEPFMVRESLLPQNREGLFVGHIRGESMKDIIPDGAKLLLRKCLEPVSGRVYIFALRGETTIKQFRLDHKGPRFEYMDGSGRSIYPNEGEQWRCLAEFLAVVD